ncbi:MAG TPA: hypothetical protein VN799_08710 [Acidimicrobiales bacterium]|nr:hypothetical protein [Acidimicrobiales bacterium]
MTETAIDRFCAGITAATVGHADVFCPDVVLDATVPNWHFVRRGRQAVQAELSGWFGDPGRFDTLRRTPLPDGELVQFDLAWEEGGVPHACRQVHVLALRDGLIARDTVWCGGRWPAALLADMEDAQRAADRASDVVDA